MSTRSAHLLLRIVVFTSKALVLGVGLAALAGDCLDFFLGAVGEVAGVGVVGRHCCP